MRKWGQHFLISQTVQKKIVDAADLTPQDEVLEIGPGRGELTQHYIQKAAKVVLVEIDPRLYEELDRIWGHLPHVKILHADFRELDFNTLGFSRPPAVLSDLPYYASKYALRIILEWERYSRAVLMLQKEVVQRLIALPGSSAYGALSVIAGLYAKTEMLMDLAPGLFRPPPKVTSAVMRLTPAPLGNSAQERRRIAAFIHSAFAHARKKLVNNLQYAFPDMPKEKLEQILRETGLDPSIRPHQVSLPLYLELENRFHPSPKEL